MRLVFFGTSEFAVPSLRALHASTNIDVVAVVTQPDRPKGRGKQLALSPVKAIALELELPILQPLKVRSPEFIEQVGLLAPDGLALASFGQIIPKSLLDLTRLGPINVHGSLLPKYRGAAPIQYAILRGEQVTGVTTMWMAPSLDTGDILMSRETEIGPRETAGELIERLAVMGAELLLETMQQLENGNCSRLPQNNDAATYSPAITMEDCALNWNHSAVDLDCRVRAMNPRPGAFAIIGGKRLKVWECEPFVGPSSGPGVIDSVSSAGITVGTNAGILRLMEVQPEGSKRMLAMDWARGARISAGMSFEVNI